MNKRPLDDNFTPPLKGKLGFNSHSHSPFITSQKPAKKPRFKSGEILPSALSLLKRQTTNGIVWDLTQTNNRHLLNNLWRTGLIIFIYKSPNPRAFIELFQTIDSSFQDSTAPGESLVSTFEQILNKPWPENLSLCESALRDFSPSTPPANLFHLQNLPTETQNAIYNSSSFDPLEKFIANNQNLFQTTSVDDFYCTFSDELGNQLLLALASTQSAKNCAAFLNAFNSYLDPKLHEDPLDVILLFLFKDKRLIPPLPYFIDKQLDCLLKLARTTLPMLAGTLADVLAENNESISAEQKSFLNLVLNSPSKEDGRLDLLAINGFCDTWEKNLPSAICSFLVETLLPLVPSNTRNSFSEVDS